MDRGIYIHIPFCKQKCGYCDFNSFQGKEKYIEKYVEALKNEITEFSSKLDKEDKNIDTIFIGGGTPSLIDEKYIKEILDLVNEKFNILKNAEITIECNPESITNEKMEKYIKSGINRVSMGVQSLDDKILKTIGRIHSKNEAIEKFRIVEKYFENKSIDLMFGLPGQNFEIFKNTLEEVVEKMKSLTHISVYSLILEEGTPFYTNTKILDSLPEEDEERKMYEYAKKRLRQEGFEQYEISNFAKKGYESKHNLNCWKYHEYYGFGIGAASFVNGIRYKNIRSMIEYISKYGTPQFTFKIIENKKESEKDEEKGNKIVGTLEKQIKERYIVEEIISEEEQLKEKMILGLRTKYGFSKKILENELLKENKKVIEKYIKNGILEEVKIDKEIHIRLTEKGKSIANIVWEELM